MRRYPFLSSHLATHEARPHTLLLYKELISESANQKRSPRRLTSNFSLALHNPQIIEHFPKPIGMFQVVNLIADLDMQSQSLIEGMDLETGYLKSFIF